MSEPSRERLATALGSPSTVFITPMTGFIRSNAVNLLDFQSKPIRGHAGGKITAGERLENAPCFPAPCVYQAERDLVKCRQLS